MLTHILDNYHIYEHKLIQFQSKINTVVYNYDLTYDLLFVCIYIICLVHMGYFVLAISCLCFVPDFYNKLNMLCYGGGGYCSLCI